MTRDPNTPRQNSKSNSDPRRRRAIVLRFAILIVLLVASSLVFNGFVRRADQDLKTPADIENNPLEADAKSVDTTEF